MEINDTVYGREEINEPVLIELINSEPVQRLKGISQMGLPGELYYRKVYSRYEHSIGVLILLKRLNANLQEQIAGLLHDVSHTAFSHVVDWVLGDPTREDYQDNNHLKIIENSEIPKILNDYGFDYKEISRIEKFPLLEKEAPSLCADRIDYLLRELSFYKSSDFIENIFLNLRNAGGQIVFEDKTKAEIFGNEYTRLQREHWAEDEARARYFILSSILKKALEKNLIKISDLMKTDNEVIELITKNNDKFIFDNLSLLKKGFKIISSDKGIELKKKFRYINPEVLINGTIFKLDELSLDYQKLINSEKKDSNLFNKIIILPN